MPREALVFYSKPDCPLCDEGWDVASALARKFGLELEKRDIRGDPELMARFGTKIPVVEFRGETLGWGRLSARGLERALERALQAGG